LPFLEITAHWISEDWELKNLLLDFIKLEGPHSSDNIPEGFLKSLSEYNLLNKVSYILYSNKQIHLFIKFFK